VFVVARYPHRSEFPYFFQTPKQIEIQDLIPVCAVEPFNEAILFRRVLCDKSWSP